MRVLKSILTSIVLTGIFSSVANGSVVATDKLYDNYIGAWGGNYSTKDYSPDQNYNTKWMKVEREITESKATLTVTVKSGFVSHNDYSSYAFGDLFLMDGKNYNLDSIAKCTGSSKIGCNEATLASGSAVESQNKWEYAFDLVSNRNSSTERKQVCTSAWGWTYCSTKKVDLEGVTGHFEKIGEDNIEVTTGSNTRIGQAIKASGGEFISSGTWGTDTSHDLLTMDFDITGTSLATTNQIALRWAMTCANDIIEVVADFKDQVVTNVPEPGTLVLLLSSIAGVFVQRKRLIIRK